MTELLQFCPGDRYVAWLLSVLVQVTAVLAIAWLLASVLARRSAAARYATWLVALSLLLISPLTGYLAISSRVSLVELSWQAESREQLAAPSPAVAPTPPASLPAEFPEWPARPVAGLPEEPSLPPALREQTLTPLPAPPQVEPPPAPASAPERAVPAELAPTPLSWADWLRVGALLVSLLWVCGITCLTVRFAWRARRLSRMLRETRQLGSPDIAPIWFATFAGA